MTEQKKSIKNLKDFPMVKTEGKEVEGIDDDTRCRLLCCLRSKYADIFGDPKVFMVVFSILNILQGMLFTYFIGVMTSFEEHFQLKSEALGAVLSIGEFIPVFVALICSYFCGAGDRPRLMAFCMFLIGLGCYIITLPYYIFGVPPRDHASVNPESSLDENNSSRLCFSDEIDPTNNSYTDILNKCEVASTQENNMYAVGLYLLGYTIFNNGAVILYIIGTPYIDDNVQQKDSPIYLAITVSMRSAGPLIGFILSFACLSLYVNPAEGLHISSDDPHWIGAWWLGYIIMGNIALLGAFLVAQFPVRLPSQHVTPAMELATVASDHKKALPVENHDQEKLTAAAKIYASIKEVLPTVRRVLTNVRFLLRLGSGLFTCFALEGIVLYLPKYLEHQFRVSQSEASMWAGSILIAPSIIGTLIIGYIIHRMRPTSRQLSMTMVVFKCAYALSLLSLMTLYCENAYVLGTEDRNIDSSCNTNCSCTALPLSPVCGSDGRNYLSACHAGCTTFYNSSDIWIYQNCSCITEGTATANFCNNNCPSTFTIYVVAMFLCHFLLSIDFIGDLLLVLRCVLVQDKTMAMGLFTSAFSLIVFIPTPLVFSAMVDSVCTLWSFTCGESGNCLLYNLDRFRYLLHIVPFSLLVGSIIMDVLFWYQAKGLMLFGEDEEEETNENENPIQTVESSS